jgi:leucyl aminopeptidase
MQLQLSTTKNYQSFNHRIILVNEAVKFTKLGLANETAAAAQKFFDEKTGPVFRTADGNGSLSIVKIKTDSKPFKVLEEARKAGYAINKFLNQQKATEAAVTNAIKRPEITAAFVEGAALTNYEFLKYKTLDKKHNSFATLHVDAQSLDKKVLEEIGHVTAANFFTRDLINEPVSYLRATQLSKEIEAAGKKHGFSVTVFDKKKIKELNMGGLLAVNLGSVDPPTFTILEWKPAKKKNKQPIVLVGKGVVYDTGGLSLKSTPNGMDMMKCDMSGAAAVAGIFQVAATLKLPIHLIGLIPATDNRPGGNAYAPGDVIKMMSGLNVEMLNADAEGRMILADALHYAKQYKPELVIDFATLTGAAVRAIGAVATAYMGTAKDDVKRKLEKSSEEVYERLIHFPLWDEYGDWIKSDVADIKNVGPGEAGHITAGKFLEHFTDYPWLHLDIAGTAYLMKEDSYRGKYGTAVGVRLITDFLKNY